MAKSPLAGALYQKLWSMWPKKTSPESSRKAIEILIKTEDVDHDRLILSAEAYLAKQDARFIHELGNWIRNNVWKDYYFSDLAAIITREGHLNETATRILEKWNEVRRNWWLSVSDEIGMRESIKAKLQERFFADHWEQALTDAGTLFRRKQEGRWRSIIPSLRWFVSGDTVARLVEGEFGIVKKPRAKPKLNYNLTHPDGYEEPSIEDVKDIQSQIAIWKRKMIDDTDDTEDEPSTDKGDEGEMPKFF